MEDHDTIPPLQAMKQQQLQEFRLIFQGNIPFQDTYEAISWYKMLKEMCKSQSEKSTLNGNIMIMMEPCCGSSRIAKPENRVL